MTGGIYTKQNWVVSDTPTFDINVWIESYGYPGGDDSDLYIGLEKKSAVTNKWSATDYAYVSDKRWRVCNTYWRWKWNISNLFKINRSYWLPCDRNVKY